MSERWFRFYDDAMHDPKVQALPPRLFKFWINILCIASKNDGLIPPLGVVVTTLRCRCDVAEAFFSDLKNRGLIDQIEGRLEPHNWRKRQYKSDISTGRVKAHRNAKRNVSETAPDTDTESEIDTSLLPSQKDRKIVSILGDAKREKPPRHCAQTSKGGGRVYIVKGTPEWESYAADYRAARGEEPTANANGGRWFKKLGENVSREAWPRR